MPCAAAGSWSRSCPARRRPRRRRRRSRPLSPSRTPKSSPAWSWSRRSPPARRPTTARASRAVDPRTGIFASGTPETGVSSLAAVLLARRYGMACDCYGPATDAHVADAQFGSEHAMNALLGLLARPRFLSGVGDVQAGASSSLEALVIDDDILGDAFYALSARPGTTTGARRRGDRRGRAGRQGLPGHQAHPALHPQRVLSRRGSGAAPAAGGLGAAARGDDALRPARLASSPASPVLPASASPSCSTREPVGLPADTMITMCGCNRRVRARDRPFGVARPAPPARRSPRASSRPSAKTDRGDTGDRRGRRSARSAPAKGARPVAIPSSTCARRARIARSVARSARPHARRSRRRLPSSPTTSRR